MNQHAAIAQIQVIIDLTYDCRASLRSRWCESTGQDWNKAPDKYIREDNHLERVQVILETASNELAKLRQ